MQKRRSSPPLFNHQSKSQHNSLKPIFHPSSNRNIGSLSKNADSFSHTTQTGKRRTHTKMNIISEEEINIDEIIANRRLKQKQDQIGKVEDHKHHRIQFSGVDKSGVQREWIASYKVDYDLACYPSLKYQDIDQQNAMNLTNQVLFGSSKFTIIPDSMEQDSSLVISPAISPKKSELMSFSQTENDERSIDAFKSIVKNAHIVKPSIPQPSWVLKITKPHAHPLEPLSIKEQTEEDNIMTTGETRRREQMSLRYKVYSGSDSMAQKRLTHQRKLSAPTTDEHMRAKSPKGHKRVELEEDRLYRELRETSKERAPSRRNLEQLIFEQEKEKLAPILDSNDAHCMEGLLYYRFKNSLRLHQKVPNNRTSSSSTKEKTSARRRRRSSFLTKLNNSIVLDQAKLPNASGSQIDMSKIESQIVAQDSSGANLTVTRVQRAVDVLMKGFDYHDIAIDPNSNPLLERFSDVSVTSKFSDKSSALSPSKVSYQEHDLSKRNAQDILTLSQLDRKIIPEQLIKKNIDDDHVLVDLSHYGIGNASGRCLADALSTLNQLSSLCLHDNRLDTNAMSYIISMLPIDNLHHLDLSKNDLHMFACKTISTYLQSPNNLVYLNISDSKLDSTDVMIISQAMKKSVYCKVSELNLSQNKISSDGVQHLCQYLRFVGSNGLVCSLQSLDLSWNRIDSIGAITIAETLTVNRTIRILNLAMNPSIHESGGKRLASCLAMNNVIEELSLNQCNIGYESCFIFAQVLRKQSSIKTLDLSSNPLGEAGARSLFRSLLQGISCVFRMENCEYPVDERVFNHSYPAEHSPYTFDMTESYDRAVLNELIEIACNDPIGSKFTSVLYLESKECEVCSIKLMVSPDRVLCDRNNSLKWVIPDIGRLTIHFESAIVVPTTDNIVSDLQLNIISDIIGNGRTDVDCKAWLRMISSDVFFNTNQMERLIKDLQSKKILSDGGLSRLDILMW